MISYLTYRQTFSTDTITGNGYVNEAWSYPSYAPRPRTPSTHNMSRRERELWAQRSALEEEIKKFGEELLVHRLARLERERKVMLDSKSRGRTPHTSTKRRDSRRMQTYEAAMAMRQLRR